MGSLFLELSKAVTGVADAIISAAGYTPPSNAEPPPRGRMGGQTAESLVAEQDAIRVNAIGGRRRLRHRRLGDPVKDHQDSRRQAARTNQSEQASPVASFAFGLGVLYLTSMATTYGMS